MAVLNKRNAVFGWAVWGVTKRVARRKAKQAVPRVDPESKRLNKPATFLAAVAAAGGALLFWRKKRSGDEPA
jgi:hypothetical protein